MGLFDTFEAGGIMKAGFALACLLTFTVVDAAPSAPTQARDPSQKVAEQTVVLIVRGMT